MKVNTIEVDYDKVARVSNYFRGLMNFKEANTTNLDIAVDFDKSILTLFFKFIQHEVENLLEFVEYSYDIRQLCIFFGCDEEIDILFKSYLEKYLDLISINKIEYNSQVLLSLIYLSKDNFFDLNNFFDKIYLSKNYLSIPEDVYSEMDKSDYLYLVKLWTNRLKDNEKMIRYTSFPIFTFDLHYKTNDLKPEVINSLHFNIGDKTCCESIEEFKNNFNKFAFHDFKNFDWNNVVVAGGGVLSGIVLREPLKSSDIDFWIYGLDIEKAKLKIRQIIDYFRKNISNNIVYVFNKSVISLCIADYERNIQIIYTENEHPAKITAHFDLDIIRCYYDGKNVYGTVECIESLITQTCINKETHKIDRLVKIYQKGFSLMSKSTWFLPVIENINEEKNIDLIKNFEDITIDYITNKEQVEKSLNKYYYPTLKEFDDKTRLLKIVQAFMPGKCTFDITEIDKHFIEEVKAFNVKINSYTNIVDEYHLNNLTFPIGKQYNYDIIKNIVFSDNGKDFIKRFGNLKNLPLVSKLYFTSLYILSFPLTNIKEIYINHDFDKYADNDAIITIRVALHNINKELSDYLEKIDEHMIKLITQYVPNFDKNDYYPLKDKAFKIEQVNKYFVNANDITKSDIKTYNTPRSIKFTLKLLGLMLLRCGKYSCNYKINDYTFYHERDAYNQLFEFC